MKKQLVTELVKRLPQATLSRAWGWLARQENPRLGVQTLKRVFVESTGINMSEATRSIEDYPSLEALFVRHLKPGSRPIDTAAQSIISPVDALVGACGTIQHETLFQIKNKSYSLSRLLGSAEKSTLFEGGSYATFYLSPKDYHRIHAPLSGTIHEATVIPGKLFPVFPEALERIDELFARNERMITYIQTPQGLLAVVKVGATMVGRISVNYDLSLRTNQKNQQQHTTHYEPPIAIQKGDELGAFELGSTVVLVAQKQLGVFDRLQENNAIQMGMRIGTFSTIK